MNSWKKWAVILTAVCVLFVFAACAPAAQNESTAGTDAVQDTTAAATDDTDAAQDTTEATEVAVELKSYLGTWYVGGSSEAYRFVIEKDRQWKFTDEEGNVQFAGSYQLMEDGLYLYDAVEGSCSAKIILDGANKANIEINDSLIAENVDGNVLSNVITNNLGSDAYVSEDAIEPENVGEEIVGGEENEDISIDEP
jgi:hypothetical protein